MKTMEEDERVVKAVIRTFLLTAIITTIVVWLIAYRLSDPKQDEVVAESYDFGNAITEDQYNQRLLDIRLQELEQRTVNNQVMVIGCYEFGGLPMFDTVYVYNNDNYQQYPKMQCYKGKDRFEFKVSESSGWVKVENK